MNGQNIQLPDLVGLLF